MKMVFLGTSAGEQYPGFWCRCENCERARQLGGRNIRRNSCAWLSPDTLIDFPAEIFMQAERCGIEVVDTRYLLFTHSHEDHCYPYYLAWRRMPRDTKLPPGHDVVGSRFSELTRLHVCGSEQVCAKVKQYVRGDFDEYALELTQLEPFERREIGPMTVTPLLANHTDAAGQRGLNYIIQREGKTILYALDTGWFLDETCEEILRHTYDLVVIEGTFGFGAEAEEHMNFRKVTKARRMFDDKGLLKPSAQFCVSHTGPHFGTVHDEAAPVMAQDGVTLAYDGLTVEL